MWNKINSNPAYNIDDALNFFTDNVNVPLTKFTMGMPLYGRATILSEGAGETYGVYRPGKGAPAG